MSLKNKFDIINEFSRNKNDTGSPEVQIALLTYKIKHLTNHFKSHKKDNHSRQGLFKMVSKRKKLLLYLNKNYVDRYAAIISKLNLRK